MSIRVKIGLIAVLLAASFLNARADNRRHLCEFGIEAGCGYYMGDAADLPFQHVREMYGANFRYRFDQRWAIQAKGIAHRIAGEYPAQMNRGNELWSNQLINLDAMAEYNFFRFGAASYDRRVKPITPYIACGLGVCLHSKAQNIALYMPFSVGVKWKFAPRFNLQLSWQNNLYFTDKLEGVPELDNSYDLNGSNILNRDLTGTISLGLTVEFVKEKKICKICQYH